MNNKITTNLKDIKDTLSWRETITPVFDNTWKGKVIADTKTLVEEINFPNQETTFWKKDISITLSPTTNLSNTLFLNWEKVDLNLDNSIVKNHQIIIVLKNTKFKIIEHILWISTWLWVTFDVHINWWDSFPTKENLIYEISKQIIKTDIIWKEKNAKTFTVSEPTKIIFPWKQNSYIMLLPDEWEWKLIFDKVISYPWKSIWTQRIVCEINDEVFLNYISKARTNAPWLRWKLFKIWKYLPVYKRFYNITPDSVFIFSKNKLKNPYPDFFNDNWDYTELVFHNILDILWAFWLDLNLFNEKWYRFVWKIVSYKNSHSDDIEMLKLIKNGKIKIIKTS